MGAPRRVLGDVFPVDENVTETNVKKWLTELIEINVVIPLEYKSKKLLFIKSWGEHQTVQHKSKRSFIDTVDLEQVIKDTLDSHETLMRNYLDSHAPKRKLKKKDKDKVKGFKAWNRDEFWIDITNTAEGKYEQSMVTAFFTWWSEPDEDGVMKFQKNDTWLTAGRLATWHSRQNN